MNIHHLKAVLNRTRCASRYKRNGSLVRYVLATTVRRVQRIVTLAREAPEPLADALLPCTNLARIDLLQLKHSAFARAAQE